MTELELIHGTGRGVYRRERCRCGRDVVQLVGETEFAAVVRHNATPEHRAWRELVA